MLGGSGSTANLVSLVNGFAISTAGESVEGVAKRLYHETLATKIIQECNGRAHLVPEILNDTLQRHVQAMGSTMCIEEPPLCSTSLLSSKPLSYSRDRRIRTQCRRKCQPHNIVLWCHRRGFTEYCGSRQEKGCDDNAMVAEGGHEDDSDMLDFIFRMDVTIDGVSCLLLGSTYPGTVPHDIDHCLSRNVLPISAKTGDMDFGKSVIQLVCF